MNWSLTPARRDEPELMDQPGLPAEEVADAYNVLGRVNRQLGNLRACRREFRRFLDGHRTGPGADPVTVLDVGSGSGDMPAALAREMGGPETLWVALDRDATAAGMARNARLASVQGDALRLPFADRSVDVVLAMKFAHHFAGPALDRLLAELARVARQRVIVIDLRRHWLAYYGFILWSRAFTRNRLVRYDGPLSVLRGFTRAELDGLASAVPGFAWETRPHPLFQIALVGRRTSRDDASDR